MMSRILAALVAVSFLATAFAAGPPKQQLRPIEEGEEPGLAPPPAAPGTTVLIPGVITENEGGETQPLKLIRLPVEAGRVSKMIATRLVANSLSWIAKGNKYYSLCVPNRDKVACAPIVATTTMKDIEVSAFVDAAGTPKLNFIIAKDTQRQSKQLIASINYFLSRTSIQVANFNRKASKYAPAKTGAEALNSPPGGNPSPMTIDSGFGSSCTYDDYGGMDCSGGDSGGGSGYDVGGYDWGDNYFGDESNWPTLPDLPTFPFGIDNGDADPCVDASGINFCQQVVITGERPEQPQQVALQPCIISPVGIACVNRPPPVVANPFEELPKGPTPWLPQSACNAWSVLCSEGQAPDAEPPPITSEERRRRMRMECYKKANAALTACHDLRAYNSDVWFEKCKKDALDQGRACDSADMDR